jgi:hypothetical protein
VDLPTKLQIRVGGAFAEFGRTTGEALENLWWYVHRVTNGIEGGVEKKWLPAPAGNKTGGFFANARSAVLAIFEDLIAIAPQIVEIHHLRFFLVLVVGIIIRTALVKTVKIIEAMGVGHSLWRAAKVPIAGEGGRY